MEIRSFNKQQLRDFVESEEFQNLDCIPITPHRAFSQIANPRADRGDVLLLMAFENGRHLGYLGILPDYAFFREKPDKIGWLSCIWISPESRGMGVAKKLLNKAFECWDNKIFATEFTPEAKNLYDKSGQFIDLKQSQGIRLYFRFNLHKLLQPKAAFFRKIRPVLEGTDKIANSFNDLRLLFQAPGLSGIKPEYVNYIDEEVAGFIHRDKDKPQEITQRNTHDLEWILHNPWILSAPYSGHFAKRYHFTAVEPHFAFTALKLRSADDELVAFLLMARRNDHLKLPYLYFRENCLDAVINVLLYHIHSWRITMFTTFYPELTEALWQVRTPAFHKRAQTREYFAPKIFEEALAECETIRFQDGDADNAFT